MDYLQEHDVEMALTINEDDKNWIRKSITRANASTTTGSAPWPKWIEHVRLWSVPTIAVALAIFSLNEWSKYIEFRTHTNDSLENIQGALRAVQVSRAAETPTNPASQAAAKAVIAEAKKNISKPLPDAIVKQAGTSFADASSTDPNAWQVALEFASYRTSLNANLLAVGTAQQIGRTPANPKLESDILLTHVVGTPTPKVTTGGTVSSDRAATIYRLGIPAPNEGQPNGPEVILMEGGGIGLDGVFMKHVVVRNASVYYAGGPAHLEDVIFVNCVFVLPNNAGARTFAVAVLSQSQLTFVV